MRRLVREWLYVREILPDRPTRPEIEDRTRTLCLIETTTEGKVVPIVVRKRTPAHQIPVVDRQVVTRLLPVLIVKADVQTAARLSVQAGEVKVAPLAEITVPKETTDLPAGETIAVQAVVAAIPVQTAAVPVLAGTVTLALPEAAVPAEATVLLETAVPAGVMFPADKQKDVLLQEVREVIAVALPVRPKEVMVQEDNLFLYY